MSFQRKLNSTTIPGLDFTMGMSWGTMLESLQIHFHIRHTGFGRSTQVAMVFMFGPPRCNTQMYEEISACSHLATGNWPHDVNDPSFSLHPLEQHPCKLYQEVDETRPGSDSFLPLRGRTRKYHRTLQTTTKRCSHRPVIAVTKSSANTSPCTSLYASPPSCLWRYQPENSSVKLNTEPW